MSKIKILIVLAAVVLFTTAATLIPFSNTNAAWRVSSVADTYWVTLWDTNQTVPLKGVNIRVPNLFSNRIAAGNWTFSGNATVLSNFTFGSTIVSNSYGTLTTIASNASTFQLDFTTGTSHYEMTNMANAVTLQLTNVHGLTGPRDAWVYFRTDGVARNVTISTNGIPTNLRVSWGFNSTTNGATSFAVTNRARLNLAKVHAGEIHAAFEWVQ